MRFRFLLFLISSVIFPAKCFAHVSERALILLLPTEFYIPAGISVLILTILIAYLTPASFISSLFNYYQIKNFNFFSIISNRSFEKIKIITSLFSFLFLMALVYLGFSGSRDPLANPLTLFIWSVWFLLMPVIQITVGNLWAFLNPWYGIGRLFFKKPKVKINDNFSFVFSSAGFLLFSLFMLVYIAPDDPDILAFVVLIYFILNLFLMGFFGVEWLTKGECFTSFYTLLSKLSLIWFKDGTLFVGFFGSQLKNYKFYPPLSVLFLSIILATLSFDGLNETFLWFQIINVNPLEFYGRSSVITENSLGLIFFAIMLFIIFNLTIYLGHAFTKEKIIFRDIIGINSIALLPIALAYHIAHYLTSFLVDIQYFYKVLSDPLNLGMDLINIGEFNVTTSFFNTIETVKLIWFIQASAIVIGHVIAVLLAHSISENYLKTKSSVLISQLPISIFMVAYTFLGLWILSTPTVG